MSKDFKELVGDFGLALIIHIASTFIGYIVGRFCCCKLLTIIDAQSGCIE